MQYRFVVVMIFGDVNSENRLKCNFLVPYN